VFAKSGMSATRGLVHMLSEPAYLVSHLAAVIPGSTVAPSYLVRWFEAHPPSQLINDSAYPSIRLPDIADIRMRLPSLADQRRTAAMLDKAGALLRERQQCLRVLDEFRHSAFLDMFGDPQANKRRWDVVRLEAIADVQGGLQVSAKRAGIGRQVPYLRVANVYRDRLDTREVKRIFATEGEIERTRLVVGDLLIVEGHGNPAEIGRCSIWDGSIDECVHQNHLIRARLDRRQTEPAYVSAVVNSASGRQQMLGFGKTTSGLNTISTRNVKSVQVPLPPLEAQRRYGRLCSRVQVAAEQSAAAELTSRALLASLAHHAFDESVCPAALTSTTRAN
jgi:type I restriction enzyme S subunit